MSELLNIGVFVIIAVDAYLTLGLIKQQRRRIEVLEQMVSAPTSVVPVKDATHLLIRIPPSMPPERVDRIVKMYTELSGLKVVPDFGGVEFAREATN